MFAKRPGWIGSSRFCDLLDDSACGGFRAPARAVVAPTTWPGCPEVSMFQMAAMIGRRIATRAFGGRAGGPPFMAGLQGEAVGLRHPVAELPSGFARW